MLLAEAEPSLVPSTSAAQTPPPFQLPEEHGLSAVPTGVSPEVVPKIVVMMYPQYRVWNGKRAIPSLRR